jgi:hypothetical protein
MEKVSVDAFLMPCLAMYLQGDRCALFVLWPTASSGSGIFSVATYPVACAGSADVSADKED